MGFLDLLIGERVLDSKLNQLQTPKRAPYPKRQRWIVDVDEFGYCDLKVVTGDLDGSGEAPGVQLEYDHVGGRGAIAFSGHEAELVGKALVEAGSTIRPSDRLLAKRRKWRREIIEEKNEQPKPTPTLPETLHIEDEGQAKRLLALLENAQDPELASLVDQLDIPF